MKGDKADGTTEVGVVGRDRGGRTSKSLLQYYQFIKKHSANYTAKQEADWLGVWVLVLDNLKQAEYHVHY